MILKVKSKINYKKKNDSGTHLYLLDDNDFQKIKSLEIDKYLCRILSGIQVSWSEEALKRLLYEKNLFTDTQRLHILKQSTTEKRWHFALKIIFSIVYKLVPANDEICDTVNIRKRAKKIGKDIINKYNALRSLIVN